MELEIVDVLISGYGLTDTPENPQRVWLPRRHAPEKLSRGDKLEVFIYNDGQGKLKASTKTPKVFPGEIALLPAVEVTKAGAFLDWGLESDLFLPAHKATRKLVKGQHYLVALYLDERHRLRATLDIYDYLSAEAPYKVNDKVQGIVYLVKPDIGAFIAVDNRYYGLIPISELYRNLNYGDCIHARVKRVREDGKLDLSLQQLAYLQMHDDAKIISTALEVNQGFLPLHDRSDPEDIRAFLEMSKSAFKRALGHLLKEGVVEKTEQGIRFIKRA